LLGLPPPLTMLRTGESKPGNNPALKTTHAADSAVDVLSTAVKADTIPTATTDSALAKPLCAMPLFCESKQDRPPRQFQPWTVGCASTKGQIRPNNQDFAYAFVFGGYRVAIVADGMGGCPLGGRASRTAVLYAAKSIAFDLQRANDGQQIDLLKVCRHAFRDADRAIKTESARRGFQTTEIMRTTLLVAIATDSLVAYGYAGDGAGLVLKNGSAETFLMPHRAPDGSNAITVSLGPSRHGTPSFGTRALQPGDLVVLCTDGISDFTSPDGMSAAIAQCARAYNGDLQAAAEAYVKALEAERDDFGAICNDNITLGLIGTGVPAVYQSKPDSPTSALPEVVNAGTDCKADVRSASAA